MARVKGTTAECMECRRRVPAATLEFIKYLGTFCPPCAEAKRTEIAVRS